MTYDEINNDNVQNTYYHKLFIIIGIVAKAKCGNVLLSHSR